MSTIKISDEAMPEFQAGNGTVGETAAQLFDSTFAVHKHVVVHADDANSGTISIGNSAARASSGFILKAGDTSPPIYIDDLSKIWLIGSAASQNFSWLCC
ncbi:MAG TPA: hypothetical protein VHV55_14685 [Pirellulales bacterium]|jgi:hypothetical protein|nr:hypothetical protein [Pirellulales bacterium]